MNDHIAPALVLATSAIEVFERVRDGFPEGEFLAYRTGPDCLDPATFRRCVSPIAWVAYWYRMHVWCAGAQGGCDCSENPRYGDGLCIVAFADGSFGYYPIASTHVNHDAFGDTLAEPHAHLTLDQLLALKDRLPPSHSPATSPVSAAALKGVWAAFDDASGHFANHTGAAKSLP